MSAKSRRLGVTFIIGVPLILLAWWLGSPLLIDEVAEEDLPYATSATVPADMAREDVERATAETARVQDTVTERMPAAAAPVALASGEFRDADAFHRGSGRATIYALADGKRILRLEAFRVTNGPDLRVLLTPHPGPGSRDDLDAAGYTELGKLKGNIGNQNYEIPADTDVAGQRSVVIYCRPFHVVFSTAQLKAEDG